jgi:hypothetical protein
VRLPSLSQFAFSFLLLLVFAGPVRCDLLIPGDILNPKTPAEAWNVIRLATTNVGQLLTENRLPEIPVQISYCSPALRVLPAFPAEKDAIAKVGDLSKRAFLSVNAIATSAMQNNPQGAENALASLRTVLGEMAHHFDPQAVAADIFYCPVHPAFLSDDPEKRCATCGRKLFPRRIAYSFIYMKPGEPTIRMTATARAPIEAGKRADVKITLQKADYSPVTHEDLQPMHTEPIHLLIEDPSLGDYHREHPRPTATPGEYAFTFTPKKNAPYRIWADIVPTATGVQELPFVDLPSSEKGGPIEDMADRFTSSSGGYQFALALAAGNHLPTKAGQARRMNITVTDAEGHPVRKLEPVMSAFAHLVGFYDDHLTVLHLHPTGGDVVNPELRGGPQLGFTLYAPKAGFIRLYCQVVVDGKTIFAPFNLNVEP